MLDSVIINKVLSLPDSEVGGDNALDGFEFQVSAAIYLVFENLQNKKEFTLVYEKLEDFIIFTNKVSLYQAKSINNNLTPKVLYKPSKVTKKNNSSLSIIEKMYDNYSVVQNELPNCVVDNNLIICENQTFSKKLGTIQEITKLKSINFDSLSTNSKNEIISNTKHSMYDWAKINAIRLIPKSRHEEVTRVYIEDVIKDLIGENKVNSIALYNSMTSEIKKIRKEKSTLSRDFIMGEIVKFASFDDDVMFNECVFLLNDDDKRNFKIKLSFDQFKSYVKIPNHPTSMDYDSIFDLYNNRSFNTIDEIIHHINSVEKYEELRIRLEEHEMKALVLLVVAKESNI